MFGSPPAPRWGTNEAAARAQPARQSGRADSDGVPVDVDVRLTAGVADRRLPALGRPPAAGGPARLRHRRLGGGPAAHRAGRRPARPGSADRWSWSASPSAGSNRRRGRASTRACSPPTPQALVARDDVDLVIEVIGGIEPARSLILSALRRGASVVTANKALLAEDGATLFAAAEQAGPTSTSRPPWPARSRSSGRCGSRWSATRSPSVIGIVNGTTNFILDKMDTDGAGFAETLAEAQELGYAEADPTADVEGFDAAAKAAILASLAFHTRVTGGRRLPRGHHRGHLLRHRLGPADRLRGQAAGHLPAVPAGRVGRGAHRLGPGAPGDDPAQPPAGRRRRRVQRGLRRVAVGRSADVLRARRRRLADGQRGAGRPGHRGPQPGPRRRRTGGVQLRRPAGGPDRQRGRPATTSRSRSPTSPACWRRSPSASPSTTCRSRPYGRTGAVPTPNWSSSPTARSTRR